MAILFGVLATSVDDPAAVGRGIRTASTGHSRSADAAHSVHTGAYESRGTTPYSFVSIDLSSQIHEAVYDLDGCGIRDAIPT
jgi:hypothetical protein